MNLSNKKSLQEGDEIIDENTIQRMVDYVKNNPQTAYEILEDLIDPSNQLPVTQSKQLGQFL